MNSEVFINGEKKQVDGLSNLDELLLHLKVERTYLAVAINNEVIPKSNYKTTLLNPGDAIELVWPSQGG